MSKIALTLGEPAGIGVDVFLQLMQTEDLHDTVIIADPNLLEQRAKILKLPICLNKLNIITVPMNVPVCCGVSDPANANYVLSTLDLAVKGCLQGEFSALVTGPVDKSVINQAGIHFTGHTEYLAKKAEVQKTLMAFENPQLRIILASTHLPLKVVPSYITLEQLNTVFIILKRELRQKFALKSAKVAVCGLNPHAGENGYLGREEIDIIIPAIKAARKLGMDCHGPYSADTVLHRYAKENFDCIVSMYHDQLLPALKYYHFYDTVNITLGLPFIRTSVDHGTALSIAGSGQSNPSSLRAALQAARRLIHE